MKNLVPVIVFFGILLLLDLYAFKSLRIVTSDWQKGLHKTFAYYGYWLITFAGYSLIIYMMSVFTRDVIQPSRYYHFTMAAGLVFMLVIPKIAIILFHGLDDITFLLKKGVALIFGNGSTEIPGSGPKIERWQFLSKIGWALAAIPLFSIIYGMAKGRYNFRVEKANLKFPNLPQNMDGLKIVHISDIHIGSFFDNHSAVMDGIELINSLNPDLIFFTGDMVNNTAMELDGWIPYLSKMNAKYGKFSVLGNHDYGDYVNWPTTEAKRHNLDTLKKLHGEMGFRLLLNEHVPFSIDGGESIEILGIENWGAGGFSKYGDLSKAMRGSNEDKVQILLSHDPSHWDLEVLNKTKIDLALAGHTHGMQFGIRIPGLINWSPSKYRYPRWGGLYSEGKQHLYVNRGFGYLGFPGRIGMPPEITLIELQKDASA